MLASCLCFSAMALCVGLAHRQNPELSSFVASAVRAIVNLLALIVLAKGDFKRLFGDMRPALWVRGLSGAGALVGYFGALERLGLGEAAFLNQTSAIWVAALAPWVLRERSQWTTTVAILASMVGIALLAHPRIDEHDWLGRGLGLISGLCAASAYLSVRRAGTSNPSITIVFYFTVLSTVVATVMALATQALWPTQIEVWAYLAGAGLCATLGQLLMTSAYRLAPAAAMSAVSAAGPLLTTLAGWIWLAQVPDANGQLGMVILFFASIVMPFLG